MTTTTTTASAIGPGSPLAAAAPAFVIRLGDCGPGRADLTLPLVRGGCWSRFFGPQMLPADDALDLLADAAEALGWADAPPREVELVGSPAACLLPALWLRTIWLGRGSSVRVRWDAVEPPGDDAREALAAQLCAQVVDEIACPDGGAAGSMWGIEPGPREPAGSAVFDSILGLIDAWDIDLRGADLQYPVEWLVRARGALEACADRGQRRIALYGAGTHTRALGPLLMQPRVEIACIIDDNASIHGTTLWGFPIVSLEQAKTMGLDAVVISANSIEEKLWRNSRPLREAGVPVIRLYGKQEDGATGAPETAAAPVRTERDPGHGPRIAQAGPGDDLSPPPNGAVLGVLALPPRCDGFWEATGRALRARGIGLYAMAWHVDAATVPLTGLAGSFANTALLGETWPADAPLGDEPDGELLARCLAYDAVYWRNVEGSERLTRRGCRSAAWMISHAAERLRPRLAVVWSGTTSFSMAADAALRRLGVPILYAERGAINPSVILDRVGWGADGRSELTEDPAWVERLRAPAAPEEVETGRRIAALMLDGRNENWGRVRSPGEPAPADERTIAYFPTIEAGAEALSDERCAAAGMPLGDSPRACAALLRAAAALAPTPRILIKLHPNEPDRARYARIVAEHAAGAGGRPVDVQITDSLGIHDAIRAGHVIATTSASVGWIALAAGAPLISLNRRAYSACPAVHRAESREALPSAIAGALAQRGPERPAERDDAFALLARYATGYCHTHDAGLIRAGVMTPAAAAERFVAAMSPALADAPSQPRVWLEELACAAGAPVPATSTAV